MGELLKSTVADGEIEGDGEPPHPTRIIQSRAFGKDRTKRDITIVSNGLFNLVMEAPQMLFESIGHVDESAAGHRGRPDLASVVFSGESFVAQRPLRTPARLGSTVAGPCTELMM